MLTDTSLSIQIKYSEYEIIMDIFLSMYEVGNEIKKFSKVHLLNIRKCFLLEYLEYSICNLLVVSLTQETFELLLVHPAKFNPLIIITDGFEFTLKVFRVF